MRQPVFETASIDALARLLWEKAGKPAGGESGYRQQASKLLDATRDNTDSALPDEAEAVVDGDPHADFPALVTRDVPGG